MSTDQRALRASWFDLESRTERVLEPGEAFPEPDGHGFLWLDLQLPADDALARLVADGVLPDLALDDDPPPGEVALSVGLEHLRLTLAAARLSAGALALDRREIVITARAIASLQRGPCAHAQALRARYGDALPHVTPDHGFLLFELLDQLVDDLQRTVRALGDRIDDLRVRAVRSPEPLERDAGAELLSSVLLLRRILVRTRDVLAELAMRSSDFVPEASRPRLGEIASRVDGLVSDLAFSRDVLSEALLAADRTAGPAAEHEEAPPGGGGRTGPSDDRPPLRIRCLGGFEVELGGRHVSDAAFGRPPGRELLAALLCARREVPRDELLRWLWPDLEGERAVRALRETLAVVRRALDPAGSADARATPIVSEGGSFRVLLGRDDTWDVEELLELAGRASAAAEPERRIAVLAEGLDAYRGPPCPEWPYAAWSADLRHACERASLAIRAALANALLEAGRPREAIAHLEAVLAADPEREEPHRGLMRAHHGCGERALALRQYHICRSVLRQSRGVEPSAETQRLYLELLRGGEAVAPAREDAGAASDGPVGGARPLAVPDPPPPSGAVIGGVRRATAERISARRSLDAETVQALRRDVSEVNVRRLMERAEELGGLDARGVRVALPNDGMRVRFALDRPGEREGDPGVHLSAEDRSGDPVGEIVRWRPREPAGTALEALADGLQRAGSYPGDAAFDGTVVFSRLADALETVLALRTGGRPGAHLDPVVELVGDWAVTGSGLQHLFDGGRAVDAGLLLANPERARSALDPGCADAGAGQLSVALATAVDYHGGETRRAARARLPNGRPSGAPAGDARTGR